MKNQISMFKEPHSSIKDALSLGDFNFTRLNPKIGQSEIF